MLTLTGENIAIQDKAKYYGIENVFYDGVKLIKDKQLTARELIELEGRMTDELRRVFNLNVLVTLGQNACLACVSCSPVNARHIFTEHALKPSLDQIEHVTNTVELDRALSAGSPGYIDLKHAVADGCFATAESFLYIDIAQLYKLGITTAPDFTTILLHEIGHIITYYIYCSNTASINQILQRALKEKVHPNTFMEKLKFSLARGTTLDKKELDELSSGNRIIFSWKLSKIMYKHHVSHATASIYDNSASESMADNFAARCGYGAEMVHALVILDKANKGKLFEAASAPSIATSTFEILRHITEHTLREHSFTRAAGPLIAFLIFIVISISFMLIRIQVAAGLKDKAEVENIRPASLLRYDNIVYRITRVRNLVVSKLKGEPNAAKRERVLEELKTIDSYLPPKDVWDKHKTIFGWIGKFLSSREKDQITMEQDLESILSNDLLVAAATATSKL